MWNIVNTRSKTGPKPLPKMLPIRQLIAIDSFIYSELPYQQSRHYFSYLLIKGNTLKKI